MRTTECTAQQHPRSTTDTHSHTHSHTHTHTHTRTRAYSLPVSLSLSHMRRPRMTTLRIPGQSSPHSISGPYLKAAISPPFALLLLFSRTQKTHSLPVATMSSSDMVSMDDREAGEAGDSTIMDASHSLVARRIRAAYNVCPIIQYALLAPRTTARRASHAHPLSGTLLRQQVCPSPWISSRLQSKSATPSTIPRSVPWQRAVTAPPLHPFSPAARDVSFSVRACVLCLRPLVASSHSRSR
jgi:hypothetical protein